MHCPPSCGAFNEEFHNINTENNMLVHELTVNSLLTAHIIHTVYRTALLKGASFIM